MPEVSEEEFRDLIWQAERTWNDKTGSGQTRTGSHVMLRQDAGDLGRSGRAVKCETCFGKRRLGRAGKL